MSRTRQTDNQFTLDLDAPDDTPRQTSQAPELNSLTQLNELLEHWRQAEWIRPLDVAFANLIHSLCKEQGETPEPLVLLLAALASHQVGRGHVCIDLASLLDDADRALAIPPEEGRNGHLSDEQLEVLATLNPAEVLAQVSLSQAMALLENSQAVSDGSHTTPLVLDGTHLYLRRLWRYEQRIAEGIETRLAAQTALENPQGPAAQTLARALDVLFQPQPGVDYQRAACALAARNRFAVITGGPGTGKTTTVVNLLAALQAVATESPDRAGRRFRIRLAAPTGKAAARLNESIGNAVSKLPFTQLPGNVTQEDIPTRVTTLHRLLGSRPDTRQFRHNHDNPLLVDILVIDEASMVDVDLMASVFDALPSHAQLVLLGDKDQLASVDAGAVLGELCQRARKAHYRPQTVKWLNAVSGQSLPDELVDNNGIGLDQAVAMLRKSYRFTEDSGIRQLAEAVNDGTLGANILEQIRTGGFSDVIWLNGHDHRPDPVATLARIARHSVSGSPEAFHNGGNGRIVHGQELSTPTGYRHYLSLIRNHQLGAHSTRAEWDELAREVIGAFNDFQILCALRQGPWGVEGLNELITQQLLAEKLIHSSEGWWYAGRPVLITGNDYNLGLMNGDIGITFRVPWGEPDGERVSLVSRVAFPSGDGTDGIRWISPSRLQQLETVYAMTVHKSQGSEFNHTCLVLPDRMSPVLTRELVYTGITRAKNWFSLITGNPEVLKESTGQQVNRASGLARQLMQR
ncbi:exodeoxyribonuclease V subunit alpha [Marinobacter salinexigens]|uniref:RecBCD enzyme subunit RecD n=1 Tax=Marinobacter salinexigens TaxID=2919747 RepID=A0A5B0VJR7_9GAMM|nr:exodeoxyribonuclease V subunit alpha [Marinobacter salinexigens]KAA1174159.1 exodeoxyribonuclease V subunit alpha [Marinobacter salinexigens]